MPLPGGIFIPVHGIFSDGHDVELAVATHIRDGHRVADIADMGVDLLRDESGRLGRDGRNREAQPEDRGFEGSVVSERGRASGPAWQMAEMRNGKWQMRNGR